MGSFEIILFEESGPEVVATLDSYFKVDAWLREWFKDPLDLMVGVRKVAPVIGQLAS